MSNNTIQCKIIKKNVLKLKDIQCERISDKEQNMI